MKKRTVGIVVLALIVIGGAGWYYTQHGTGYAHHFVGGESVSSWDFQGAYSANPELTQKAQDEITRLEGLLGKPDDDNTDYALYVGIANQYALLGDGAHEYEYLKKAIAIDPENTGLAWNNLGGLLDRLGAHETALDAYAHAVKAQNQIVQYQIAYLTYLTEHFPDQTEKIEAGFNDAKGVFGDNASLLEVRARWLESMGRVQEAIDTWKKIKELSPSAASVIDAEITRLQGRL